ncbi:YopJ/AvrA family T3SS effector serine/threonine acetyltransferase [Bartonella sp. CB169]|uniref:YopJ/AvrA family T3SS effector serine/threonine acetyltransferase n=1 Tax=Bartonella sp. CB169 TaxID=3112257 RepID=UPI00300E00C9
MKPSKHPPSDHSRQMQGSDNTGEAKKAPSAALETESSPKEDILQNLPFSRQKLEKIIESLEDDITRGAWKNRNYVSTDLKLMPALVEQANVKYSGLNLKFVDDPSDFARSVEKNINDGVNVARFLVYTNDKWLHFSVIDQRTIGGKTSVIFFESTTFDNTKSSLLAIRSQLALQNLNLPNCRFSIVEMDIQRSSSECAMFSLALAKKLHTESEKIEIMHQKNIDGVLCEPNFPLPSDKVDMYLPASFYKHTQGRRRMGAYIKSNPDSEKKKINKKGETLTERFTRNLVELDGKSVSVSPHKKRIVEYKNVLKL